MGDAQARRAARALGAPLEPALLGMPAMCRIAYHGHDVRAHAERSLRQGRRRFRAEPETTGITNSAVVAVVIRVIYQTLCLFISCCIVVWPTREDKGWHVATGASPRRR